MDKQRMKAFLRDQRGSTIAVTVPSPANPNDKDIIVDIRVPYSDVSLVDILGLFQSGTLGTSVTMRQE